MYKPEISRSFSALVVDGMSKKTAYYVINTSHEYDLLSIGHDITAIIDGEGIRTGYLYDSNGKKKTK